MRLIAAAWLVCQVATLSAFVPDDCCMPTSERAQAAQAPKCHEHTPAPATEGAACPMHQADGAACPMAGHSGDNDCAGMRQGCKGIGDSLASLFAFAGDLAVLSNTAATLVSTPASCWSPGSLLLVPHTADAPPPKA